MNKYKPTLWQAGRYLYRAVKHCIKYFSFNHHILYGWRHEYHQYGRQNGYNTADKCFPTLLFSIPLLLTATNPPIRNMSATIIIVYACRNGKKLEHNTSKMPVPSIQAKYSKALSIRGFFSKPLSSLATWRGFSVFFAWKRIKRSRSPYIMLMVNKEAFPKTWKGRSFPAIPEAYLIFCTKMRLRLRMRCIFGLVEAHACFIITNL